MLYFWAGFYNAEIFSVCFSQITTNKIMKHYNLLNKVIGWLTFAIAAVTYIVTTEDSASFWDCGEFIATANNLLVGHPPGAPFFMIVGRFFAILAPSADMVAQSVNIMSALASAFTILFLFWTITLLARKIFIQDYVDAEGNVPQWRVWAVMGAGLVGALAYTYSDTFWFSAVEGEVYALSSLFTAVVFWAILMWELEADKPHSNRWIILIAYLMGLSIGVHLLNLLAIPAIVMVYYFKKYTVTTKNTVWALLISCVVLAAVLYGIIPGVVKVASYFELLFVNEMGMGFNSGAVFYAFLLISLLIWGIWYTYKYGHKVMNLICTAVAVIILGYSSFAMVVIRSVANPTMDQNSPEDVFSLISYLDREQYGNRPLFYGQAFNSRVDNVKSASPIYMQHNGKYEVTGERPTYTYLGNMVFPRMYSSEAHHIEQYKSWSDFEGRDVVCRSSRSGENVTVKMPTMLENLRFFFSYQVNFMYWRYFMWNFCGRQNDIQGHGELVHGNWITGIPVIDNLMLGDQDLLPESLKNNKGHNVYFMLPFLLGLLGMFFQAGKGTTGKQGFWIVMLLFFLTGLAIVIYLNQTPVQPRERDYAYAGSFYAFCIWIGFGVLAVVEALQRFKMSAKVAAVAATVMCLFVPGIMAQQNWDDHDRSGSTIARDVAYNYLHSVDENAVIFTNGDNDTFPLWYLQEVEGVRPDVRVCNLSYLNTAWYCDQMARAAYSDPLPISFSQEEYTFVVDEYALVNPRLGERRYEVDEVMRYMANPKSKNIPGYSGPVSNLPHKMKISYNPDSISDDAKCYFQGRYLQPDSVINIDIPDMIYRNRVMVLDMLSQSKWQRPIYYAATVGPDLYFGLNDNMWLEGLAYRVAPTKLANKQDIGNVDVKKMYHNMMNRFRWGLFNNPDVYLDETKMRLATTHKMYLTRLAEELIIAYDACRQNPSEADSAAQFLSMAVNVLDKAEVEFPATTVTPNVMDISLARCYKAAANSVADEAKAAALEKCGADMMRNLFYDNFDKLIFYESLDNVRRMTNSQAIQRCGYICNYIVGIAETDFPDLAVEFSDLMQYKD